LEVILYPKKIKILDTQRFSLISREKNNIEEEVHKIKYTKLKINKFESVVPKNMNNYKNLMHFRIKNYKDLKNKQQFSEKGNIEILNILTDNSLISIQIPNLKLFKNNLEDFKKHNNGIGFNLDGFNFNNYIQNLNMDYKVLLN